MRTSVNHYLTKFQVLGRSWGHGRSVEPSPGPQLRHPELSPHRTDPPDPVPTRKVSQRICLGPRRPTHGPPPENDPPYRIWTGSRVLLQESGDGGENRRIGPHVVRRRRTRDSPDGGGVEVTGDVGRGGWWPGWGGRVGVPRGPRQTQRRLGRGSLPLSRTQATTSLYRTPLRPTPVGAE